MSSALLGAHEAFIHVSSSNPAKDILRCDVTVDQEDLDALVSLIHWLEGYAQGSGIGIPGHEELVNLYRKLRCAHNGQQKV